MTDNQAAFAKAVKDGKLNGVPPRALALIQAAQPFHREDPTSHFLSMLNKLNNINKHRRVLLTHLQASVGEMPADFPHIKSKIKRFTSDGEEAGEFEAWSCLRVSEDVLPQAIEILSAADALFEDTYRLIQKFSPLFWEPEPRFGNLIAEPATTRAKQAAITSDTFSSIRTQKNKRL